MGPKMSRSWTTLTIVGLLATGSQMVLLGGCSSTSLAPGPLIDTVPAAWDYTTDPQAYAVYIGESVQFSAQIQNPSGNPLTVKSVTPNSLSSAFTLAMPAPAGTVDGDAGVQKDTINGPPDSAIIQVTFTPTAAKLYQGTITIASNALNDGDFAVITINALGVDPDAGIPADAGVLEDAGLYDDGG